MEMVEGGVSVWQFVDVRFAMDRDKIFINRPVAEEVEDEEEIGNLDRHRFQQ